MRNWRASSAPVIRRMADPLPPASQPSNTRMIDCLRTFLLRDSTLSALWYFSSCFSKRALLSFCDMSRSRRSFRLSSCGIGGAASTPLSFLERALVLLELLFEARLAQLLRHVEVAQELQIVQLRHRRGRLHPSFLSRALRQAPAQRTEQYPARGEAAGAVGGPRDDDPRGAGGAGLAQGMLGDFAKLVVDLEALPVLLGHAPARLRV